MAQNFTDEASAIFSRRSLKVSAIISISGAGMFIGQEIYEIVRDKAVDAEFCASPQATSGFFLPIPWGSSDTCNLDLPIVGLWFLSAFVVLFLAVFLAGVSYRVLRRGLEDIV